MTAHPAITAVLARRLRPSSELRLFLGGLDQLPPAQAKQALLDAGSPVVGFLDPAEVVQLIAELGLAAA